MAEAWGDFTMLRSFLRFLTASAVCAACVVQSTVPANADDILKRITVNVAPVYLIETNGDSNAPPPPGYTGIGYTQDHPYADTWRIDYGIDIKLDEKTHLTYSHGNVGYGLGRILTLAPLTSFVSGALFDYTDTIALSHTIGGGVTAHVTYFSHQRQDVTGLCLNQKYCPNPTTGQQQTNPLSINEMGYTLGATWDFGPTSRIGKIFTVGADIKYLPRPAFPPSANQAGVQPALGGLPGWVGTQTVFPYSITAKIPVLYSTTVIPTITYINLPVLYHDSAVPEEYRGFVWGVTKVFSKNITFSYTNFNLQSCRCVARVPPPDNLRLAFGVLKLDFHTQL